MPLYEYQCESCEHRFERIQKFSDPLVDTCPSCGGPVKKLLSSPAIQFKGSGFYITDYPKKSQKPSGDSQSSGTSKDSTSDSSKSSTPAPAKDSSGTTTAKKD
jgi:putative FmdB family regulatory protein